MALSAVHGNRAMALLGALIEALPPADPFAPTTIVVGSHLVSRWLTRELAIARGIAAGLELVTFDRFIERTWSGDDAAQTAGLVPLDKSQLAAALASVLADPEIVAPLGPVRAYLDAAPEGGDRAGPRRVQLAEQVAQVAWNYALTRPDWMTAFLAGKLPSELAGDDTATWQAALIAAALARAACDRKICALVPVLPSARRAARIAPPRLSRPVFVFGVSYLLRAQLEALSDLAVTTDVTVFLLDPCAELWDDVTGRGKAQQSVDPLPLTLWGRAIRDTLGALVERTSGDIADAFVEVPARTARDRLLADVLHRRLPAASLDAQSVEPVQSTELGIRVLACPDARREIEIVAAEVRARLDADPSLHARDIGVWIASDAERYLAQAPSAFEAVRLPCHLIDAPLDDRGRIGEAMLALLELPTGGMARRDLLRVMTHPAVLAAHPHVDAADWVRWTEKLGIVHGADQQAHANTYLAEHPGRFHWDQGVRRLALGAFMIGDASRGPVSIGGMQVAPEEVRPEQHASAATYALLVRSLCGDAAFLATHEATLSEWATIFVGLVDAYLTRPTDEAARDVERVRSMLAGIAHVDLDSRRVGFREAREHAARRLVVARSDRGEPLASGVMVAPLAVMRALPFRVAFVVGLAEGSFPASDQPSPLDIRRDPRPGDVAPRDRDRHAFFEVLLGASDALYLSYVAVEAKSGQVLGPSSVVLELADALAPYLGAPSSKDALDRMTTRLPLHRHTGDGTLPPAIVRERWAVRVRDALRAHLRANGHPIPDEDGMLSLLGHEQLAPLRDVLGIAPAPNATAQNALVRPVSLANVRTFLEAPVQAWAQAVLGLYELPDDEAAIEHSDEPFHVDRPARAVLLREVLAAQLREPGMSAAERYDAVVRDLELRGQFPVGVFGSAERARDLRLLDEWRERLGPIAVGSATRLAFGRSSSPYAELLPALELTLPGGRTVRLVGQTEVLLARGGKRLSVVPMLGTADKAARHHLRGALDHVVLAAAGLAPQGHAHLLLGDEETSREVEHLPWAQDEARAYLTSLVGELLDAPHGYLLPFVHLVSAYRGKGLGRLHGDAMRAVLGYGPIERVDGLAAPPDAQAIAERRFGPLATRMQGDHGFAPGGDA